MGWPDLDFTIIASCDYHLTIGIIDKHIHIEGMSLLLEDVSPSGESNDKEVGSWMEMEQTTFVPVWPK